MTDYLLDNGIVELELNDARGWRGSDVLFLAKLPQVKPFKIIDLKISSIDAIHFLHELRTLEVTTYCQTEIRFSAFPQLKECALEWRPKATSLFHCTTLKELFVNRYDGKDVTPFARLVNLESLAILNAPVENLYGLSALKRLRFLRLAKLKRLTSLAGIEGLANLEELEIHTCRAISSINEVGSLSRLQKLHFNNDGDIESLKPLEKLNGLESVLFYESTNILDGDLSPLLGQKNLSRISFQNRRHYSHRREEFSAYADGLRRSITDPRTAKTDPKFFELLRVWVANKGQHVSMRAGARIASIQDVRSSVNPPGAPTLSFTYNNDPIPHLASIANAINSQDSFSFTYNPSVTLASPFGSSGKSFGSAGLLSSVTQQRGESHDRLHLRHRQLGRAAASHFPARRSPALAVRATAAYSQTSIREVADRYLFWDASIGERAYTLAGTRNSGDTFDIRRVLTDSTAKATKTYSFNYVGSAVTGIISSVSESGGTQAPRLTSYTWAQNSSGNNYISRLQTTLDSGTGSAATKQVDQFVDGYGNVTQTKLYDYSDLAHPSKTFNTTYLSAANYTNLYIRNRRVSLTLTDKTGKTTRLKQNTYDQYPSGITATPNVQQQDSVNYGPSYTTRGNIYDEAVPSGSWHHNYDQTGTARWTGNDINPNHYVQQARSMATNYAAPDVVTTADSLNTDYGWTASLQNSTTTGPNQDVTTVQYDTSDRPHTVASPYGASTVYQYSTSAPQITAQTNNHWVKTYLDGLGRVKQVQTGDNTSTKSSIEIYYDACGCSPTGKAFKRSMPHLPGATVFWKISTFDALGRLVARTRPDGSSTYRYAYAGNNTTVTDPTGKWKTFTTDPYGQVFQVVEPSPRPGTEPNHATFYTYDVFGHLIQVHMDRTIGGVVRTQYRTWVYNPATLQLTSKTSPETGTVNYTYNTDGTLATVTDAKSQRRVYGYDSYGRITQIARGTVSGGNFKDTSQRTNYSYSGTNGGFSSATAGRVSQITYSGPHGLAFKEWYSYHNAGAITAKRMSVAGTPFGSASLNLDAGYVYDNEGNVTSTVSRCSVPALFPRR